MGRRTRIGIGSAIVLGVLASMATLPVRSALPVPRPALTGNRAPYQIQFAPDARTAYVTEWAEESVAAIDVASGRVVRRLPTGGRRPTGLALTPDGRTAVVTNSEGASVAFLDLAPGGKAVASPKLLALPGMPYDVVLSPDGGTAYVALSQIDQVAVVDVKTRTVTDRIGVGMRPRALARTPDGARVVCANMRGTVSVIDAATRRETSRVRIPAVNLRGIAVTPDGRAAFVTAQRAQNERPTETAVGIWSNQLFSVSLDGARARLRDDLWLDVLAEGVADAERILLPERGKAFVTFAGSHTVGAIQIGGDFKLDAHVAPGCGPRGLALTPDGRQLWVANHLGNSVSVLDATTLATVKSIDLGKAGRPDPNLYGRYLFESAFLAKGGQFSCNSCHPDGHTDGISWQFVHVKDGVKDRNVRSLLGGLGKTAPFRWSGHDAKLVDFVQTEITGLFEHPRLNETDARALVRFLEELPLPPNPHRGSGDVLTPAALRGRALFREKAACVECHAGPSLGGTGRTAWVGTTRPELVLDVPHLVGVHDTGPFLHDGRAATLEEVFSRYNAEGRHGKAQLLTAAEMSDLLAFVREL